MDWMGEEYALIGSNFDLEGGFSSSEGYHRILTKRYDV